MKRLSFKFIRLLVVAALVPLVIFGLISIYSARRVAYDRVIQGNQNVARRAASEINIYLANSVEMMKTLADNLSNIRLTPYQQERIIKNYVIDFNRLEEIIYAENIEKTVISSRSINDSEEIFSSEEYQEALKGKTYLSDISISTSMAPILTISVPVIQLNEVVGALIARVNLIDMWYLVDSIRIGEKGFALVVTDSGRLVAHGDGNAKADVLRALVLSEVPVVRAVLEGKSEPVTYRNHWDSKVLAVASPLALPDGRRWGVVIEQATSEALYAVHILTIELALLIIVFLVLMSMIGYYGGRAVAQPLRALVEATGQISRGNLDARVQIETNDELSDLGDSFNKMAGRLLELTDEIRRKERIATFGRIAAGLAHDLRHPIQNIENNANMVNQRPDDPDVRRVFKSVVEREFKNINEFLDRLGHLTKPTPLQMIDIRVNEFIQNVLKMYSDYPARAEVEWMVSLAGEDLKIRADKFALERIVKNIVNNALEAMNGKGRIQVVTRREDSSVLIEFSDSGPGIPPERMKNLFEDFTTTKRKGLGLGLATAWKMTEEMGGNIQVESKAGEGTTVRFIFPSKE